ncbi:MAG: methyltransferase domain-containing protein [Chloroflexi bacterium]|nr:methyltransferase domain-containing protein [Chloroflexota bacterium]
MSGDVRGGVPFYDRAYEGFELDARARVRQATYGEDLGQNSWLTAEEWRTFAGWLGIGTGTRVLDVACGSGGPALYFSRGLGADITGVDHNPAGVAAATRQAEQQGLTERARFTVADASQRLPFEDGRFDAVVCIDAISHLPGRLDVLRDWRRLLKPGGRLLFTNPITITGLLTKEEMEIRSSIGFFLFAAPGVDERLLRETDFDVLRVEDTTMQMATVAKRWLDARAVDRKDLLADEGPETYESTQRFLTVAHTIAAEGRLSRFAFLAQKPG